MASSKLNNCENFNTPKTIKPECFSKEESVNSEHCISKIKEEIQIDDLYPIEDTQPEFVFVDNYIQKEVDVAETTVNTSNNIWDDYDSSATESCSETSDSEIIKQISDNYFGKVANTAKKTRRVRYIGDMTPDDFSTPDKCKQNLFIIIKRTISQLRQEKRHLQKKVRLLQQTIDKLKHSEVLIE